jgi:hypothetical protein
VRGAVRKPVEPVQRAKGKARSASRASRKRVAAPSSHGYYARLLRPWILPLTALLLAGYAASLPPLRSARAARPLAGAGESAAAGPSMLRGAADPGLKLLRLSVKGRRTNPGSAPAHLRDVVF